MSKGDKPSQPAPTLQQLREKAASDARSGGGAGAERLLRENWAKEDKLADDAQRRADESRRDAAGKPPSLS